MGLFGFGKKKDTADKTSQCKCGGICKPTEAALKPTDEEKHTSCCCGNRCNDKTPVKAEPAPINGSAIKVLGSNCAKCNALEAAVTEALKELGLDTAIEHVTDFTQIAAYGVMSTPALVVDDKVVSFGKVLKKDEIIKLLRTVQQ